VIEENGRGWGEPEIMPTTRIRMDGMGGDQTSATNVVIDRNARPKWKRTGYKYFPYAAEQSGKWWVLRLNPAFPEHDMYTVFVDGHAAVDVTGDVHAGVPVVASVGALTPSSDDEPALDADTAEAVVSVVSGYVDYGSEHGDPCLFCSDDRDGMTREH
jgi:hypothetical protein